MGGPQLGVNSSPEGLHGRALASYPGPRELGLEARLVLLDGGAEAVRGRQGDALLGQQQSCTSRTERPGVSFFPCSSSCEFSTTSLSTALHLLASKARA